MTTTIKKAKKCALCMKESLYIKLASTYQFGYPDLDTRPPEGARLTIYWWIQICPNCGYCAHDITENIENALKIVKSDSYQKQLHNKEYPKLANSFICYSMIQENINNFSGAGWSYIHAAWACDDAEFNTSAQKCRMKAINILQKAKLNNQKFAEENNAEEAIMVDLLRRSRQFEIALNICDTLLNKSPKKNIADVLLFQKMLIKKGDIDCHTMEEAI